MKKLILFKIYFLLSFLFLSCNTGYEEKDGKIYYKWIHGGHWTMESTLVEADASTFTKIKHDLNIHLGKDKNHVFVDASILEQADPTTFKQVKEYYWKDKNYVYLLGYGFGKPESKIKQADPNTFMVLKDDFLWAKDKNNVFYAFDKLINVNQKTFSVIDEDWGKDDSAYFFDSLKIDSLDYKSAEIVNTYFDDESGEPSEYIKDKNKVFFRNRIIKDANPKTFVADGVGSFGHDDKYMFVGEDNEGKITEQYRRTYIQKK